MKKLIRLMILMTCVTFVTVGGGRSIEAASKKFSVVALKQSDYLYVKADFNSKKQVGLAVGKKFHVIRGVGEFYQGTYGKLKGYVPKLAFVKATDKKTAYFSPFYDSLSPKSKRYDIPALSDVSHLGAFDAQYDRVRYKGVYGYLPKTAFTKVYKIAQKNTAIYTPALGDPVGEIPVGTNLQILKEQRTLYTVLYKGKPTLALKSDIDGIKNYVRIKNLLPEKVFDQTMTVIHPKQSYLDWMKTDYDYVKRETDKDKLLEEFKTLSEYLNGELVTQIQNVKGMYYSPIYTSGKMLVVENAMRNRLAVLYPREGETVMMPEERFTAEMYKVRDDYRTDYTSIDAKQNALNRARDLEIYNSLDQLPFSEKTFDGIIVNAVPYSFSSGDGLSINSGSYSFGSITINTNVAQDVSVRTLYHEMGHFLDNGGNFKMTTYSSDLRGHYDGELAPEDFVETHYPYYNKNRYFYDYEFNILPKDAFAEFKRLSAESLSLSPIYENWITMNDETVRSRILYSSENDLNFHHAGYMMDLENNTHEYPDNLEVRDLPDGLYSFNVTRNAVYKNFTILVDNVKGFD